MSDKGHLLRVLGIVFGLAAVVGSVVGQGILRAPGVVAQASESPWILIALWVLGGILAAFAALPFAELGAALPSAGGVVAFAGRAFGPKARLATAFTMLLMLISALAGVAIVAGEFLVRLGVGGGRFGPGALATFMLVLFFVVNAPGTRMSGTVQILFSATKGVVLMALAVVLFSQPGVAQAATPIELAPQGWLGFATAMLVIVGAYNGWGDVVVYGEEIEDPGKQIPRAIFGGILGITLLYVAVNLALLHRLTPAEMASSEFAAADAAGTVFGGTGDLVFTLFGLLSISAICSLMMMTISRITYDSAREGILPSYFATVTPRGTPLRAMTLVVLGSAAFLWSGTYLALSSTSTSLSQAIFVLVALCSMRLHITEPGLVRPLKVPFFWPLMCLLLLLDAVTLAVFIAQDPYYALLGFGLVAALSGGYWLLARIGRGRYTKDLT